MKATLGMKRSRKPWDEKLRPDMQPKRITDPKGRGIMLLPTPLLVAAAIREVPEGALLTVSALRARLAKQNGADLVCPLMTGIFFNIIAGAAEAQLLAGQAVIAPYWRIVSDKGTLSEKTPAGSAAQASRLEAEGHAVQTRGAKRHVLAYSSRLAPG